VILLRAEPVWPHDPTISLPDGRIARVVACGSPLAIRDQLVHAGRLHAQMAAQRDGPADMVST
jgi:hypothetical protein